VNLIFCVFMTVITRLQSRRMAQLAPSSSEITTSVDVSAPPKSSSGPLLVGSPSWSYNPFYQAKATPSRPASPSPSEISSTSDSEYVPRGDPEFQALLDRNPVALMDYLVHKSIQISDQGPPIQQVYDYSREPSQALVE
ncbi:hypothetical protein KI387_014724, partial [Taxus chinensis]